MTAPVPREGSSASAERRRSLLNFHWEAEIQGLRFVFEMLKLLEDEDSQINLARLAADEARHLWLVSKEIVDLGGTPMPDSRAHRMRRAQMVRIPKDAAGLLALAVAAKERACNRYTVGCAVEDPALTELRQTIAEDEKSHLAWLKEKLARVGGEPPSPDRVERYLAAEEAIYAAFTAAQPHSS
jgi:rubrerythrin